MRKLLLFGLVLVLLAGCKKAPGKNAKDTSTNASGGPSVHAPTGIALQPGLGGGGSGGAAQAVRRRVGQSINEQQMHQLHLFIEGIAVGNKMPSEQEINSALQKDGSARQLWKLVQDKVVVIPGTRSRSGIWAYTSEPQTAAGQHLVLLESGVTQMSKELIDQRLGDKGQ